MIKFYNIGAQRYERNIDILGGAMFGGFVAILTFCMLAGIRIKSETKKKRYGEGDKANVYKKAMPSL